MNHTTVQIDSPPSRANIIVCEVTVRMANTGCTMRDLTVALAARAPGNKLPAFVIIKELSRKIRGKTFMSLHILGKACSELVFHFS
ncbi:hypothetical protein HPB48_010740 [Haemaphysalis longicornis]|uniref:Uncharacterized protein n=1 Tax=Haemaphysalis longicornis TaxID=44386 RepID=A0A9J6FP75_HAELO|nr:hypothetical protein HPB48_010740 [Haemaphysalis longicornis]